MSYIDRICDDYGLNKNKLSKKTKIRSSTISSAKQKSIKSCKAENLHKLSKTLDASMDELYKWYK